MIVRPFADFPWPEPRPTPESEEDEDDASESGRKVLPRLAPPDPRYDHALVRMQMAESEFAELKAAHAPREWLCESVRLPLLYSGNTGLRAASGFSPVRRFPLILLNNLSFGPVLVRRQSVR